LALGIPGIGVDTIVLGVPGEIVGKAGEMVVAVSGCGEAALLGAAGVCGVRGRCNLREVAPSTVRDAVVLVSFTPAVGGTRSIGRSSESGGDSIELIIGKRLGASGVEIVGDREDVATVLVAM